MKVTQTPRAGIVRTSGLVLVAAAVGAIGILGNGRSGASTEVTGAALVATDRNPFLDAYAVFMHPRCANCHPSGDAPLQGDDMRPHAQNVQRGVDGKGLFALKCANCHQASNLQGAHMPPGNPNWHLPPSHMKMVFVGRTAAQLASQLKDPEQNGGKSLEQILHHVEHDSLVLWGWEPGDGRTTPPISHKDFVGAMKAWIDQGAPIPE
jgi:hypothetical protein